MIQGDGVIVSSIAGRPDFLRLRSQRIHGEATARPAVASAKAGTPTNPGAPNAHACALGWESGADAKPAR